VDIDKSIYYLELYISNIKLPYTQNTTMGIRMYSISTVFVIIISLRIYVPTHSFSCIYASASDSLYCQI